MSIVVKRPFNIFFNTSLIKHRISVDCLQIIYIVFHTGKGPTLLDLRCTLLIALGMYMIEDVLVLFLCCLYGPCCKTNSIPFKINKKIDYYPVLHVRLYTQSMVSKKTVFHLIIHNSKPVDETCIFKLFLYVSLHWATIIRVE